MRPTAMTGYADASSEGVVGRLHAHLNRRAWRGARRVAFILMANAPQRILPAIERRASPFAAPAPWRAAAFGGSHRLRQRDLTRTSSLRSND